MYPLVSRAQERCGSCRDAAIIAWEKSLNVAGGRLERVSETTTLPCCVDRQVPLSITEPELCVRKKASCTKFSTVVQFSSGTGRYSWASNAEHSNAGTRIEIIKWRIIDETP